MQAMTIETRRAPGGRRPVQCPCFPFVAKGESTSQGIGQRLPFRCNETKTSWTEVTVEPKTASSPVLLAAEDHLWSG